MKEFLRRYQLLQRRLGPAGPFLAPASIVLILSLALLARPSGDQPEPPAATPTPAASAKPLKLAVPEHGAYTGAYIDFGEAEGDVTLEAVDDFEDEVGKHQAIIAFSSFWGEQTFPADAVRLIEQHDSVPLVFWSPWDWPYSEDVILRDGPDKFRLDNIVAGKWDAYIDLWADAAKAAGGPIMVSLCNEMNGDWFPWSGKFYGGSKPVPGTSPVRYEGPELFKRAYRYIVDRVRARGASNILWVFHVNNYSEPVEPWTTFEQYYPGSDYVDWLGMSVYGQQFPGGKWDPFPAMMKVPYEELCRLDPSKPVMLCEWAVGEFPDSGDKAGWISGALNDMETKYPRLAAAVYWHERWQNTSTMLFSNMKVNSSPAALAAYRHGVASSFWIDRPILR